MSKEKRVAEILMERVPITRVEINSGNRRESIIRMQYMCPHCCTWQYHPSLSPKEDESVICRGCLHTFSVFVTERDRGSEESK